MVKRTPHPGSLPIGSADSADAEKGNARSVLAEWSGQRLGWFSRKENVQLLFLLPKGEGQDEGEGDANFISRVLKFE
jgi:hypothetical protein